MNKNIVFMINVASVVSINSQRAFITEPGLKGAEINEAYPKLMICSIFLTEPISLLLNFFNPIASLTSCWQVELWLICARCFIYKEIEAQLSIVASQ